MERLQQVFAFSWMLTGAFIIWNPRYLSRRLVRSGSRQLRYSLMLVAIYLCATLVATARDLSSPWNHILVAIAVIGVVKALGLLRASIAMALGRAVARLPSLLLRMGGVCYVVFGVWLILRGDPPMPDARMPPDSRDIEELTGR